MPINDPTLSEFRKLDQVEPEVVDLPILTSGDQVAEAADPSGAQYAFVECSNGFYWVFHESAGGPEVDNSGACHPALSEVVLDAGKDALRRGLSLALIGELQAISRGAEAAVVS